MTTDMKVENYFQSLATEIGALQDRVRYLIEDHHWQTDGEWKESVMRQILRRHLPQSVNIDRGFVVTSEDTSHQCDILITNSSKPVLFRDGDLVFVTPDAVLGIIEVKSKATPRTVAAVAKKLGADIQLVRRNSKTNAFAAMFSFEEKGGKTKAYLNAIAKGAPDFDNRLNFICIGNSRFIRFWEDDPEEYRFILSWKDVPENSRHCYQKWHSYKLTGLAPGYFVHNIVDFICRDSVFTNREVWFPHQGKEPFLDDVIQGHWINHEHQQ
jgi:hypothetical protein